MTPPSPSGTVTGDGPRLRLAGHRLGLRRQRRPRCACARRATRVGVLECGRRFARRRLAALDLGRAALLLGAAARDARDLPADALQGRRDRERRRGRRRLARLRQHALPRAPSVLRGPAVGRARRLGGRARAALRRGGADARRRRLRRGRNPPTTCCASSRARSGSRTPTPRRTSACCSTASRGSRYRTRSSAAPGPPGRLACAAGAA